MSIRLAVHNEYKKKGLYLKYYLMKAKHMLENMYEWDYGWVYN